LLDVVREVFFKHIQEGLLVNCAKVIKYFLDVPEIGAHADKVKGIVAKELLTKLTACTEGKVSFSLPGPPSNRIACNYKNALLPLSRMMKSIHFSLV
jgi:hypothetical protein